MPFNVSQEVKDLLTFGKQGLSDLKLIENTPLTKKEIEQLSKDYPPAISMKNPFRTIVHKQENKEEYKALSKKILDYLVINIPSLVLKKLEEADSKSNLIAVFGDINTNLENSGINATARYLGANRVPVFVDDEQLFKKMLWMEWIFAHALKLVEKKLIVDFYVPVVGGPRAQIERRLKATTDFINEYIKLHKNNLNEVTKLRTSYQIDNLKQSYDAAIKALSPELQSRTATPIPEIALNVSAATSIDTKSGVTTNTAATSIITPATESILPTSDNKHIKIPEFLSTRKRVKSEEFFDANEEPVRSRNVSTESGEDNFVDAQERPDEKNDDKRWIPVTSRGTMAEKSDPTISITSAAPVTSIPTTISITAASPTLFSATIDTKLSNDKTVTTITALKKARDNWYKNILRQLNNKKNKPEELKNISLITIKDIERNLIQFINICDSLQDKIKAVEIYKNHLKKDILEILKNYPPTNKKLKTLTVTEDNFPNTNFFNSCQPANLKEAKQEIDVKQQFTKASTKLTIVNDILKIMYQTAIKNKQQINELINFLNANQLQHPNNLTEILKKDLSELHQKTDSLRGKLDINTIAYLSQKRGSFKVAGEGIVKKLKDLLKEIDELAPKLGHNAAPGPG